MVVEALLDAHAKWLANGYEDAETPSPPARNLAIVACMDSRNSVGRIFDLAHGEAIVIRSAGATVDDGVLRSLVAATQALGVEHVVVMGHNQCGMLGVGQDPSGFAAKIGAKEEVGAWMDGFTDAEENVREGLRRIAAHPHIKDVSLAGLLYDNATGEISRVS